MCLQWERYLVVWVRVRFRDWIVGPVVTAFNNNRVYSIIQRDGGLNGVNKLINIIIYELHTAVQSMKICHYM